MKYFNLLLVVLIGLAFWPDNVRGNRMNYQPAEKIIDVTLRDNGTDTMESGLETDEELFEKTVGIIKDYESLHNATHWPLIGYGHRVRRGEKYRKGVVLSEKDADKLLREDLKACISLYKEYGRDAYLLGALAYNCGQGRVARSKVLAKLRNGDRNIRNAYLAHSKAGGKFRKQLHERRSVEYEELFQP